MDETIKAAWVKALQHNTAVIKEFREYRRVLIKHAYNAGLNQREIAEALGVTKQHVSHIINGIRS